MIRAALQDGSTRHSWSYHGRPEDAPERGSGKGAATLGRASGGIPADRLCAWAGRSGRRLVFSVTRLDPDGGVAALPLEPGMLVLAVHRPAGGRRRILWAAAVETDAMASAVRAAAAGLASSGQGELHCRISADPAEAAGLAAEFASRPDGDRC